MHADTAGIHNTARGAWVARCPLTVGPRVPPTSATAIMAPKTVPVWVGKRNAGHGPRGGEDRRHAGADEHQSGNKNGIAAGCCTDAGTGQQHGTGEQHAIPAADGAHPAGGGQSSKARGGAEGDQAEAGLAESNPYYATYLEGDVRLSDRLTINLGVRWDIFGGRNERYDRLESFDPGLKYTVNGVGLTGGEVFVHNHNTPYATNLRRRWMRPAIR